MQYYTIENRYRPKTPAGTDFLDIYSETIDKNGKTYLKKIGKTNIKEKIQASYEETQIYNIINKFITTGDISILKKREGIYGNFINIPKTPIELQNTIMRAEKEFETLDKEVRNEFENDVGMFKQSILNGTFENRMQKFIDKKTKKNTIQNQNEQEQQLTQKQEATNE